MFLLLNVMLIDPSVACVMLVVGTHLVKSALATASQVTEALNPTPRRIEHLRV